jgi:hypothetical protein
MARSVLKTVLAVGLGVGVGIGTAVLALGMSGFGEGWNSAFISSVAVLGAPLAALAWSMRERRAGFFLAGVDLLGALAFDLLLWHETLQEGTYYVAKVWRSEPEVLLIWGGLFVSWQIVAALVVFEGLRERARA